MLVRSQNGYVVQRNLIATYTIPGTRQRVPLRKGDTATVLLWVAARWHREVEPLHVGWCWGYAFRPIRGSVRVISNHASGTALDLNAPAHSLGTRPSRSFTSRQIKAIHRILADTDGCVRWGGDYSGRPDPMHVEVVGSAAAVGRLATKLRGHPAAAKPAPHHAGTPGWYHRVIRSGDSGPDVRAVQQRLREYGWHGVADGRYGPATVDRVKHVQRNHHLDDDGVIGPQTAKVIG